MTDTFTYEFHGKSYTSVVSRDFAERVADLLTAAGIDSPYALEDGSYVDNKYVPGVPKWTKHPAIVAALAGAPDRWQLDVAQVLGGRHTAVYEQRMQQAVEALDTTEAIRQHLRTVLASKARGRRVPELADLSSLAKVAGMPIQGSRKPVYAPTGGKGARLLLRHAVRYAHVHEAYADHSYYAVPVVAPADFNTSALQRNLNLFADALRTHNGIAGSGCTWSAELKLDDSGKPAFVVLNCRASICD